MSLEMKRNRAESHRRYHLSHKSEIKERHRLWYLENRDKARRYQKQYRDTHKEERKQYKLDYISDHLEEIKEYRKEYNSGHREEKRRYESWRRKNDINFRLARNLRSRLTRAVKNNHKSGSSIQDLGCSIDELKLRLQRMFYPNSETGEQMTWENYGSWHIDHIIPLASFDLVDRGEFLEAVHWTNLQPMWAKENLSKHSKTSK